MHHPLKSVAFVSLVTVALSSRAALADPPAEASRSIYRLDVSITGLDEGAHAVPATYMLILQEGQTGTLSTGANVPLVASMGSTGVASPRQDVGLSLHFSYTMRGNVLVLSGGVEMSAVEGATAPGNAATIHRVRAESVAPVTPGTPALFSSVYDLTSHHRYEVSVSARRLL